MYRLLINVESYLAETDANGPTKEMVATRIVEDCLYHELKFQGPNAAYYDTARDPFKPAVMRLHVQVILGITGIMQYDLPSSDIVVQAVQRFIMLRLCDVIRSVEEVRVSYAPVAGAWELFDVSSPLTAYAAEAPLSA